MSVVVTSLVHKSPRKIPSGLRVTLLALADYADDGGGSIYPAIPSLAKKVGKSPRQVQRDIAALIRDRILVLVKDRAKQGKTNTYSIDLGALSGVTPVINVTPVTDVRGGCHGCPSPLSWMSSQGCHGCHPTRPLTVNKESVSEPSFAREPRDAQIAGFSVEELKEAAMATGKMLLNDVSGISTLAAVGFDGEHHARACAASCHAKCLSALTGLGAPGEAAAREVRSHLDAAFLQVVEGGLI